MQLATKQRFFLHEVALNRENTRIWQAHYKPEPAYDHIADWRAYLDKSWFCTWTMGRKREQTFRRSVDV